MLHTMHTATHPEPLSPLQLDELVASLLARIEAQDAVIAERDALIARHTQGAALPAGQDRPAHHELAIHKRWKFGRRSEQLSPVQARQQRAGPILIAYHAWLTEQRRRVPGGSAIARAIHYSLKRWTSLVRCVDDPLVPIDTNHIEGLIRPVAIGRGNWLFADSLRAGQRSAAIMSLIQSAELNGQQSLRLPKGRARAAAQRRRCGTSPSCCPSRWGLPAVL